MTEPAVTQTWFDELGVTQPGDAGRGGLFRILLGGLGSAFGRLHDVVRDTTDGVGWSSVLDPDRAPVWALSWLAQFAGVRLVPGLTEAQQRAQITSPAAFERGTRLAMIAAAQTTLTGTMGVRVYERSGGPYNMLVVTRTSDTPDVALTERKVRSQKPIGLLLTYATSDGPLIDEGTRTIDAATGVVDTAILGDVT